MRAGSGSHWTVVWFVSTESVPTTQRWPQRCVPDLDLVSAMEDVRVQDSEYTFLACNIVGYPGRLRQTRSISEHYHPAKD